MYQATTVSGHHCIRPPLYQPITVLGHHCIGPPMYQPITESGHHCIRLPLYQPITVSGHHCIGPPMYQARAHHRPQRNTISGYMAFYFSTQTGYNSWSRDFEGSPSNLNNQFSVWAQLMCLCCCQHELISWYFHSACFFFFYQSATHTICMSIT